MMSGTSRKCTAPIALCALLALAAGCGSGGGGGQTVSQNGLGANIPGEPLGTLTLDPLKFSDLQKMSGKTFYVRADRGESPGKKYAATLNGTDGTGGYRTAWLSTDLIVGSGDSGTTTYDEKGSVAGALAFGSDGNSTFFGVTSIEDMMWAADHESEDVGLSRGRAAGSGHTLAGFAMGGLNPHRLAVLNQRNPSLGARFNRYRQLNLDATRVASASSNGRATASFQPGETFAVMAVEGPDLIAYAYGSVTLPYKNRYLCWGHPLYWAGSKQNYPVKRTQFVSMVNTTFGAYKFSVPYGSPVATMTSDLQYCVVVDPRVAPDSIPVSYTYTLGTKTYSSKPDTLYHVTRLDPVDALAFSLVGPVETAAHQLGANDLSGSGQAKLVITMKDGTQQERETVVDKSDAVMTDLLYQLLYPDEAWELTQTDVNNIKSIDVTMTLSN